MQKINTHKKFMLTVNSGLAYFLMDLPVQMTGILPSFSGIKHFLPFTLGLFFGAYGVIGCIIGCIFSALIVKTNFYAVFYECFCIALTGLGIFYSWHALSKSHRISFKTLRKLAAYIVLVVIFSALCCNIQVSLSYCLTGLLIGIPVNILFSSILYVEPVIPSWCSCKDDAECTITSEPESLEEANEILETSAKEHNINIQHVFELQSCIEEFTIRIFNAEPNAKISVRIIYGEAISARLLWPGKKYNPLIFQPDEDEVDIMSLKIIKHRALRASYKYLAGHNNIHVVI